MPYDSGLAKGHREAIVALGLAPGTVFAGFTIERTLGVGGMGTVYLARHPRLPRAEALKLLRPELSYDPDFAVRFAREADIAARLSHPNIVGVNDRGVEDGQLWISMPFIDGKDAEQALAECHGPMPAARAVRIVAEIAAALDFAHRNGLWHRDVKPANILLAAGDEDEPERVLLTDFGIAKAADEGRGLTKTGNVVATFDYAPPEQIEGRPFDHRVDIYALGCVLYKLLTGSVPYPGTSMAAAFHGHLNRPPPRPTERIPWLAPGLDAVIARAMAKIPDERYSNCRALASDARAALESLPAAPPLPYAVSARRTDPDPARPMVLGPIDTQYLSPADQTSLVELVRQARLFDLPESLPTAGPDWADFGTEPPDPPTQPADVTVEVRAGERTAVVTYDENLSARPPALDELVSALESRGTWQPVGVDSVYPTGVPAAVTVVEDRPDVALFEPPPPPPGSGPAPAPLYPGPPGSAAAPTGPASPRRRRKLVAAVIAVLLVVGAAVTAFVLNNQDPGSQPGSAQSSSTDAGESPSQGSGSPSESTPPTSADLGLPSATPLGGDVLVANQEVDGNLDLYAVDSSTGETRARLTTEAGLDFGPVIAPDRTSVVYLRQRAEALELWVVASDGTGARPLFAETPAGCDTVRRPAWNPADPTMLAVPCVDSAGTSTLQLVTPWGSSIRTVETGLAVFDDLSFSPDGTTLVFWGNADPAAGDGPLYVIPSDGSAAPTQLTDATLSRSADPIWSPSGTQIAFRAWFDDGATPANSEIFVIGADGSNPQRLAPDVGTDQDPAWSPDGSMIAYKSNRDDGSGIAVNRLWIMNADGSSPRLLTPGAVLDGYAPAWANR